MIKQLTLFCTLLATLAFLGFSATAVAHPCKHHDLSHPHCDQEPGDDSSSYYFVDISGEVDGVGVNWTEGNNGQIGYNHFETDPPSAGFLELAFFQEYFNNLFPTEKRGRNCFPCTLTPVFEVGC